MMLSEEYQNLCKLQLHDLPYYGREQELELMLVRLFLFVWVGLGGELFWVTFFLLLLLLLLFLFDLLLRGSSIPSSSS